MIGCKEGGEREVERGARIPLRGKAKVTNSSTLREPERYFSTIPGSCVLPFTPPNALPFHTRPVTSWKGRVAISSPMLALELKEGEKEEDRGKQT